MSKNPLPIQEALKIAKHTENVEVIELPLEGDQRVLVRSKLIPEFAFMVWTDHQGSTYSWLGLDLPDEHSGNSSYQLVCACCNTETYGVTKPSDVGEPKSDSHQKWLADLGQKFRTVLEETCKKHGITTVFMRRVDKWDYGEVEGVRFAEAMCYQEVMLDLYGRIPVKNATQFISQTTSRGM